MSAFTMFFLKSHHEAIQDVVPELFPHSFLSVVFSWSMQIWVLQQDVHTICSPELVYCIVQIWCDINFNAIANHSAFD